MRPSVDAHAQCDILPYFCPLLEDFESYTYAVSIQKVFYCRNYQSVRANLNVIKVFKDEDRQTRYPSKMSVDLLDLQQQAPQLFIEYL